MEALAGVTQLQLAPGTADFSERAAMSPELCNQAMVAGAQAINGMAAGQLFIAGEMGIGNTSSAAALASALLQQPASLMVGAGTGIDQRQQQHKQQLIEKALSRCDAVGDLSALAYLQQLGGLEIAAICGSFIAAAERGISILLDGYICTAAALVACRINPGVKPWLIAGHRSQEPGHSRILNDLNLTPLLDLQLRLGEGSGAALCLPLLQQACSLHNTMATFTEAGVSQ
jgi:nicotinate-nucleotide--dimethylbenzimidazole phosphoribosyltransferase